MSNNVVEIHFGGEREEVEFLAIAVRGRAYRHSQDFWDGNWLLVTVTFRVGKFSGSVPGMLRAEELQKFRTKLQALSRSGTAAFTTAEGWLALQVETQQPGSIRISGTISDDVGSFNSLKFAIETDQAALPATLKQLQRVTELFPVIGRS